MTAALASLGCGNPTALAELKPGERVLDLGSGGGIDVLLSARRVGPTGFAYGLDMTDAMLELAEQHNLPLPRDLERLRSAVQVTDPQPDLMAFIRKMEQGRLAACHAFGLEATSD